MQIPSMEPTLSLRGGSVAVEALPKHSVALLHKDNTYNCILSIDTITVVDTVLGLSPTAVFLLFFL